MNRKTAVLVNISFLVVGLVVGFGVGTLQTEVQPNQISSQVSTATSSIMIDYGDGRVKIISDMKPEPQETMLSLMQRVANENSLTFETKEYKGLGPLITRIGDKENGSENKYWQYWVNNVSPQVGIGQFVVKPESVIEWKFIQYQAME